MDFYLGIYADNEGYGLSVSAVNSHSKIAILECVKRERFSMKRLTEDIKRVCDKYKSSFHQSFINNLPTVLRVINNNYVGTYFKVKELNISDGITTLQGLLNDGVLEVDLDCKENLIEELKKFKTDEVNHLLYSIFMCLEYENYSCFTARGGYSRSILETLKQHKWLRMSEVKL